MVEPPVPTLAELPDLPGPPVVTVTPASRPAAAPAVLPDVPAVEDKLNFGPYARTLLDIILNPNTQTPLTIGIFGSWGSGKTSLMKMIEAGLRRPPREELVTRQTFTVWFNAWLYSKEDTLWRALVMQVLGGLRRIQDLDAKARAELNQLTEQLYRAVGPSELGTLSIAAAELLKEENTNAAQLTLALQHGLDFLENIAAARQQSEVAAARALRDQVRRATALLEQERIESLERFQEQFRELIEQYVQSRGFLVVFVDDLDRCLPEKAVEVLEAIKLFLDVPGCIFILGIDRDVIERGIRLRYGEMGGIGDYEGIQLNVDREAVERGATEAAKYRYFLQELYVDAVDVIDGERYLEKIIQIPFVLPPISPQAMGRFVAQLTPDLPDPRCGLVFVRGLEPNPRQVKRALNIFALLWALAQNLSTQVSPVRLAKLVVLQQRHGDLYERLRQEPSLLIAWERAFRARQDREGYAQWLGESGSDWYSADELKSADAPFPEELEAYDEREALEWLLTMHPLTGADAAEANFVDMTPAEVHNLVFLAYTAESGPEIKMQESFVSSQVKAMESTPPEIILEATGPVPLYQYIRFSQEEISYVATQALEPVTKLSLNMQRSPEVPDHLMRGVVDAGRRLAEWLGRQASPEVMDSLRKEGRIVQMLNPSRGAQVLLGSGDDTQLARLPWEMVFDADEDPSFEKVSLKGFWGGRHIIERPLEMGLTRKRAAPPPTVLSSEGRTPRVDLVLDWGIDATHVQGLFSELEDTWPIGVMMADEPEALRRSLLEDPADVYVVYGRGWQEIGESVIGIGKGYPLMVKELREWQSAQRKGPLAEKVDRWRQGARLFYFALQGDPTQEIDWSAWLAVLQPFGAAGIIAPLIYTPGEWPLRLMRHFFRRFLAGEPVGESLRDARLEIYEESGNPLGLICAHFGLPELRLARLDDDDNGEID
ncbi:MAG: KAP family P-loop NTPase fold protein [Chloroflexota bacterium]